MFDLLFVAWRAGHPMALKAFKKPKGIEAPGFASRNPFIGGYARSDKVRSLGSSEQWAKWIKTPGF